MSRTDEMSRRVENNPVWTEEMRDAVWKRIYELDLTGDETRAFVEGAYFLFSLVAEDLWILEDLRK